MSTPFLLVSKSYYTIIVAINLQTQNLDECENCTRIKVQSQHRGFQKLYVEYSLIMQVWGPSWLCETAVTSLKANICMCTHKNTIFFTFPK